MADAPAAAVRDSQPLALRAPAVYVTVLVIATCGLVYELVAGTLASYVLGDSVTQFSTVIGAYLSAMGLGAWLSRFVVKQLARRFVEIELAVALLGGFSAPALFLAFAYLPGFFRPALYTVVVGVGTLVGLEIPLVMRLLRDTVALEDLLARVLAFDYLGALADSLLFPLLLVPRLGLVRTALLFGLANAVVGLWSTWLFASRIPHPKWLRVRAAIVIALLAAGLAGGGWLSTLAETEMYADEIVYSKSTRYQRIVLTRAGSQVQMFLNGNLQFSSTDEYRYHEALVHPAMALVPGARRVLICGGGDGLAAREVLKHPGVSSVTLVDLDPGMTQLSANNPLVVELNHRSLSDPRVTVVNDDALAWLAEGNDRFDVAIMDFPDPHGFSVGKLYTTRFYRLLRARLEPGAAVAVQATSPLFARQSFWCIARTMERAGFNVHPYQTAVPSFGVWGFMLATLEPSEPPVNLLQGLRSLDDAAMASMFVLGPDVSPVDVEVNSLDSQVLVRYYESEWARFD